MRALRDTTVDVYVDGGVRNGRDVFKALALGAKVRKSNNLTGCAHRPTQAVFIGRPQFYALHYGGARGVCDMLTMLNDDFKRTMMLAGVYRRLFNKGTNSAGCARVSQITADHLLLPTNGDYFRAHL